MSCFVCSCRGFAPNVWKSIQCSHCMHLVTEHRNFGMVEVDEPATLGLTAARNGNEQAPYKPECLPQLTRESNGSLETVLHQPEEEGEGTLTVQMEHSGNGEAGQIGYTPLSEEPAFKRSQQSQRESDEVSAALSTGLRPVPLLRVSSFLRQSYPPPLLSPLGQKKEMIKPNGDSSTSITLATMKGEVMKLRSLLLETTSYLQQKIEEQQRQQRLLAKEKDALLKALEREKFQHFKDRERLEEYQASVVQLKKQIQKLKRQLVKEREVLQIQTENMMLKLIEDLGEELGTPRFSKNFALQKATRRSKHEWTREDEALEHRGDTQFPTEGVFSVAASDSRNIGSTVSFSSNSTSKGNWPAPICSYKEDREWGASRSRSSSMEYPEGDPYDDILSDRSESSEAVDVTSRAFRAGSAQADAGKLSGSKAPAGVPESRSWHSSGEPSASHQFSGFSSASNLLQPKLLMPSGGGSLPKIQPADQSPRARKTEASPCETPLKQTAKSSSHSVRKMEDPHFKEPPDYGPIGDYVVGKNRKSKLQRVFDEGVPSLPSSPPSSPSSRVGIVRNANGDAKSFGASTGQQGDPHVSAKGVQKTGIEVAKRAAKSGRKKRRLSVFVKKPTNDDVVEEKRRIPSAEETEVSATSSGSSIAYLLKRNRRFSAPEVPAASLAASLEPEIEEASLQPKQKAKATLWKLKFGRKSKGSVPASGDAVAHRAEKELRTLTEPEKAKKEPHGPHPDSYSSRVSPLGDPIEGHSEGSLAGQVGGAQTIGPGKKRRSKKGKKAKARKRNGKPKQVRPLGDLREKEGFDGDIASTSKLGKEREVPGTALPEQAVLGKENKKKLLSPREVREELDEDEAITWTTNEGEVGNEQRASKMRECEQGKYKLAKSLLLAELDTELHAAKDKDREQELERAKQRIRDRIDKDKLHRGAKDDTMSGNSSRLRSKLAHIEARDFIPREAQIATRVETELRERDNSPGKIKDESNPLGGVSGASSKDKDREQEVKVFSSVEKSRRNARRENQRKGESGETGKNQSEPFVAAGQSAQDPSMCDQEPAQAKGRPRKAKKTRGVRENSKQRCVSMAPMMPSNKRLAEFLQAHHLSRYYGLLLQHDVPYEMVLELTREDFVSLHVPTEDIAKFQRAIQAAKM